MVHHLLPPSLLVSSQFPAGTVWWTQPLFSCSRHHRLPAIELRHEFTFGAVCACVWDQLCWTCLWIIFFVGGRVMSHDVPPATLAQTQMNPYWFSFSKFLRGFMRFLFISCLAQWLCSSHNKNLSFWNNFTSLRALVGLLLCWGIGFSFIQGDLTMKVYFSRLLCKRVAWLDWIMVLDLIKLWAVLNLPIMHSGENMNLTILKNNSGVVTGN